MGVKPSKKNVTSIIACSPPKTYTDIRSFTGVVGHYRHFIKGFAHIAAPLYDLISGVNKDKKSELVELSFLVGDGHLRERLGSCSLSKTR